jgi:hypothetical protein
MKEGMTMANVVTHRKVKIVVLEQGEALSGHCRPGDIAIEADAAGWWLRFVGEDGAVESYDLPYPSCQEAMWSAKAAAEFGV